MTVKLIDLDAIMPDDRALKIDSREYLIPGSPPMEWYLWQQQFLARVTPDDYALTPGDFDEMQTRLLELLQVRDPKIKRVPNLTPNHLYSYVLLAYAAATDDDSGGPPPRRTRGGTGSKPPARSRRRS